MDAIMMMRMRTAARGGSVCVGRCMAAVATSASSRMRMRTRVCAQRSVVVPSASSSVPASSAVTVEAPTPQAPPLSESSSPSLAPCGTRDAAHDEDRDFMRVALSMAHVAFSAGEVPVGAAAVHTATGTLVATAHNESERRCDPTAHAEMLCLRRAAKHPLLTQGWRDLRGVTLYVTLEPCAMCAGAVLQARVGRVVYGARSTLLGAHGSWVALLPGSHSHATNDGDSASRCPSDGGEQDGRLISVATRRPHPYAPDVPVRGGVLADECGELMRTFFRERSRGRAPGTNAEPKVASADS